jgi:hypothetical protein
MGLFDNLKSGLSSAGSALDIKASPGDASAATVPQEGARSANSVERRCCPARPSVENVERRKRRPLNPLRYQSHCQTMLPPKAHGMMPST